VYVEYNYDGIRVRACAVTALEDLESSRRSRRGGAEQRLHGAKASVGERAAQALSSVAALIQMMFVKEDVEGCMKGLDLSL
jgi:hypothetical protein